MLFLSLEMLVLPKTVQLLIFSSPLVLLSVVALEDPGSPSAQVSARTLVMELWAKVNMKHKAEVNVYSGLANTVFQASHNVSPPFEWKFEHFFFCTRVCLVCSVNWWKQIFSPPKNNVFGFHSNAETIAYVIASCSFGRGTQLVLVMLLLVSMGFLFYWWGKACCGLQINLKDCNWNPVKKPFKMEVTKS